MMGVEEAAFAFMRKHHQRNAIKTIVDGTAYDITDSSFTLKSENLPDIQEVRMHAIDDNLDTRMTIYPKVGSSVLVGIINNLPGEAVLISCSEIERVLIKMNSLEFEVSATTGKVTIKKGNDSLGACAGDLINEVCKIVVILGTTPNVAALQAIKTRLQQFLG